MIKNAPKIDDQPIVVTERWRTFSFQGDVYIVCIIKETGNIRTTTAIKESNPDTHEFTTESGRIYRCVGEMAPNSDEFTYATLNCGLISSLDDLDDLHIDNDGFH